MLTKIQEEIVNTKGNLIVKASAGTGKTFTMVNKIEKELDENKSHKVIAAITFTIKAAKEIKDRLSVDVSQHFIGTNNSFAIEEIIKPFMKDVYGIEYDLDMGTDYSIHVEDFEEGLDQIIKNSILPSYEESTKNFIFELAYKILSQSEACKLYLKSKYFKIYIDEYQDCDKDMHKFFMYISDVLCIDTFVVGDEKQSIYIWRGAYPQAFKSIWDKDNFSRLFMGDNFRSVQQIQNYSNILINDTRHLYKAIDNLDSIIWVDVEGDWAEELYTYLDLDKEFAILRFSHTNAKSCAENISELGTKCKYIPRLPISDVATEAAWLYMSIAQYCVFEHYSVYDLISEIPVESDETRKSVNKLNRMLYNIEHASSFENFVEQVVFLANYLNIKAKNEHITLLYNTIIDEECHVAFDPGQFKNVSITFHSSKGLEFEQVVIFAEDYRLDDMRSIYNHYVAVTRAKSRLIIVKTNTWNARMFEKNLIKILNESSLELEDIVSFSNR